MHRSDEGNLTMFGWDLLIFLGVIAGWVVLNRWILPRLGIST